MAELVNATTTKTVRLSQDETDYLMAILQNPIMHKNAEDEPANEREIRRELWTIFSDGG